MLQCTFGFHITEKNTGQSFQMKSCAIVLNNHKYSTLVSDIRAARLFRVDRRHIC